MASIDRLGSEPVHVELGPEGCQALEVGSAMTHWWIFLGLGQLLMRCPPP